MEDSTSTAFSAPEIVLLRDVLSENSLSNDLLSESNHHSNSHNSHHHPFPTDLLSSKHDNSPMMLGNNNSNSMSNLIPSIHSSSEGMTVSHFTQNSINSAPFHLNNEHFQFGQESKHNFNYLNSNFCHEKKNFPFTSQGLMPAGIQLSRPEFVDHSMVNGGIPKLGQSNSPSSHYGLNIATSHLPGLHTTHSMQQQQQHAHNSMFGNVQYQKTKPKRKLCRMAGCSRNIRSRGLCKAHGGGKQCLVTECNKEAQNGNFCIGHGGGKRCKFDGCSNAAQSQGLCKAHGGGARCKFPECPRSSQGGGFCRSHGGGKRCKEPGCTKGAQRGNLCAKHGGYRPCCVANCNRTDRGGGYCELHRKDKLCSASGCKRLSKSMGMCTPHIREWRATHKGKEAPPSVSSPVLNLQVHQTTEVQ